MRIHELFEGLTVQRISRSAWPRGTPSGGGSYIDAPYSLLKKVFGEAQFIDGDKTSTEWTLKFSDGTYGTIYDYKQTNIYSKGLPSPEELRKNPWVNWHIGGPAKALYHIAEIIAQKLPEQEFIKYVLWLYHKHETKKPGYFPSRGELNAKDLIDGARRAGHEYPELNQIEKSVTAKKSDKEPEEG